jgi:hypothetical protein
MLIAVLAVLGVDGLNPNRAAGTGGGCAMA